ncbi:MAG: DUF2807 domain-containing protein [Sphingomonadales bacterium]|nr:MAG: DUF2807 domain-containing protein [Sphingomonadales bacterium]
MRPIRPLLMSAAAVTLAGAAFAFPGHSRNALDDGMPIPSGWAATGNFDKVSAAGPDTVRFTTGQRWQVRAEGDARPLERLRFLVKDGQLVVGRRSGDNTKLPAATIYVTAPSIRAATLAGSGAFAVDRLAGEQVSATVAGSGDLTVSAVAVRSLNGTVAGSGDLTVAGRAERAHLTIAGSGTFDGRAFAADGASVTVAGSGDMTFRSNGTVNATITGSGDIAVHGNATCKQSRIGSGRLTCGV